MVEQRGSLGAASIGDRVYAVGGGKPGQQSASMEILDVARNTWLPGKLMHHKRYASSLNQHFKILQALTLLCRASYANLFLSYGRLSSMLLSTSHVFPVSLYKLYY